MKLDHCALPTANLTVARARLVSLGFTVAPDAVHPFGTANCCVFFGDDTYLEPLAVVNEEVARRAISEDNAFVLRDSRFREACGEEGFSALALGTADAASDHTRFVNEELSAGPLLSFSRPFIDAHGDRTEASFKLAFAAPDRSPSFFFTCERVKMPGADRNLPQQHENQVTGILRILATAGEPSAAETFLTQLFQSGSGGGVWPLDNVVVSLLEPEDAKRVYNLDSDEDDSLRLRGIVFRTASVKKLAERLAVARIAHTMHRGRLVVPPAPGQGAYFVFEEPENSAIDALLSIPVF